MNKRLLLFVFLPIAVLAQQAVTEKLDLKNGDIAIPGTLSYIDSPEKQPLAIFVHGSGTIDRDGNAPNFPGNANYLRTLADSLNVRGIAFYRYDKRSATVSNLEKMADDTIDDLVADVRIAINHFKNDARFSSITLIGHSQGSLVAMLAIDGSVSKYVSLAGAGQSIDHILVEQLGRQQEDMGKTARRYFDELRQTDTILEVNPFLQVIFAPRNQKFLKHWMMIDPTEEIAKVTIPILIVNGDADMQVEVTDAEKLHAAAPGSRLQIIPKMNHVLKKVNTISGNMESYSDEKFPLSVLLVETLEEFIKS
ncbi:alpha/beta hydrolase [Flavobacteriaceae bacterium TP-CH-4]|uniref:Alpha/beta hydrolase n=1 Tax=Pelagihabitans pacificus TaxID=2696054 RepID=A0A967AVU8_9FLAO|nr:alpha/beta fold hydrolase [Pelagihabitans pacificus]NHF61356.1 alpha/beta hydrolase [Pelagihabitans pacificus]